MKSATIALLIICVALTTAAGDTDQRAPRKNGYRSIEPSPINPEAIRQGGDAIDDAITISAIPYTTTGTTSGFTDDYDEVCPYEGSASPDVVYAFTPPVELTLTIDLYGSAFDTKIYVYDVDLVLVACNDDYYQDFVSKLENVPLVGGAMYYVVIDGYGGDHGDYVLNIVEYTPCVLECPPDFTAEGEPALVDDYVDVYNGGCNTPSGMEDQFQDLWGDDQGLLTFCAVSGWYSYEGHNYRDTDWFHVYAGDTGVIELIGDAERPTYVFEEIQQCDTPVYIQHIEIGPCTDASMILEYQPGTRFRLVVVPTTFSPPWPHYGNEYDYVIWFSGLAQGAVPTESRSWTEVKSLFR